MTLLDHLIRDILGKLEALADGPTQNLDPDKRFSKHAESAAPSGATFRSADQEPKKEHVSLFEWYRWQFEHHAGDDKQRRVLWMLACDDYEDFRFKADHRIELRKGELLGNDPRDGSASERAQAERIVAWYEGKDPVYVAFTESRVGAKVTEAWVKKARAQLGRNPEDGRPRATFLDLDEDDRRRKVAALAGRPMSQQKVADRLGIGKTTVQRYWPAAPAVAA